MEKENNQENMILKSNFITAIIEKDLAENAALKEIITRFPPEPNGYLHIGHAKSICLNFGLAQQFKGKCNLRMDDTNPSKEEDEYVKSITEDVKWLGFDWQDRLFFASDYYEALFDFAVDLIKQGKAYVCDLTAEEIRHFRGTLTAPGKESPYRNRPVEENFDLFARMKNGEFEEGSKILRAKIDMASPNINMRDPAIYRILKQDHHRTGGKWCVYPMYDFAHPLSDALEGITHSICTLEFEDHRPLYNWFIENLIVPAKPKQIEFARLNITHTVLSKRKLLELVEKKYVAGWDDPRMPTIAGIRRRGYTPEAIREFCDRIGVAKANSLVDMGLLDFCLREDLNKKALRVMAVLHPIKVVITNYPEGQVEELAAENNPEDQSAGIRKVPFGKEIYIEKEDFMENPPKGYFRMFPGSEVRLKHAYYVKCEKVIKNEATGEIIEIQCTYDPQTKGGWSNDGRKVKGTLHWVFASNAIEAEVRLPDHLFTKDNMDDLAEGEDYKIYLNPNSIVTIQKAKLEPSLAMAKVGQKYQFLRQGYFCLDSKDSKQGNLVFNRIIGLKDTWGKRNDNF